MQCGNELADKSGSESGTMYSKLRRSLLHFVDHRREGVGMVERQFRKDFPIQ